MSPLDYMHRQNRPTALQIQYIEELNRIAKKRGAISQIAEKCEVNHAAVSRFFQTCKESGYLDKDYELTDMGRKWLEQYTKSKDEAFLYFMNLGMTKEDALLNANTLIENFDLHTVSLMVRQKKAGEKPSFMENRHREVNVCQIIKKGKFPVSFQLVQCVQSRRNTVRLSMADQGFEKPALLHKNNRGVFLELTIREMKAFSGLTGEPMIGHMTSLKYEENGVMIKAEIRDRRVKLPLEVFQMHALGEGRVEASLPVILTCSVGRKHMPESSALLILWL